MIGTPRLDLNRLVGQIVLDVALLRWFSDNGRRVAALSAIAVTRQPRGNTPSWISWSGTAEEPPMNDRLLEIERLQEAERRALAIVDERAKENVALRAENERLRAALARTDLDR
jgi:hypothetical protein